MLSQEQLLALLSELESDRVERTISTNKVNKFGEAICAFANDLPGHGQAGYLLLGVHNNGALSGLRVTDELLQRLGAIRSDGNVLPQPAMSVARFSLDGGDVAVVEVLPSDMPPVRYRGQAWIQVFLPVMWRFKALADCTARQRRRTFQRATAIETR